MGVCLFLVICSVDWVFLSFFFKKKKRKTRGHLFYLTVGEGEKLVRTLFAVAISKQPSVIFMDEVFY